MIQSRSLRLVAVSLAGLAIGAMALAQAKPGKTGATAPAAVAMPATDRISMADFKKLHASGNIVTIDVRSMGMYTSGHIPGALSIPEETINAVVAEKLKRMGKPIATYCS